ncbi:nucleotidyltransferase domain-containing protein [Streptococcus suis]|uniref:nucleotidyltransferase domain-containing protein n=1 Tax=Streptococcus suis TaxID=1307 RepID=UPI0004015FC8|nr:nucleotidyltransferase domain-containing protein [Streptococcus suis]NQH21230.1 nucleotidyltransferase domain-containing protein [Streptococcus suis]CYU68462.1 Predicted nucleotidyltransferase [Streptococcus suis]HEL1600564.1 nucleotidyltransferase domain-containing protein [Streptococcus suis]HEL9646607.1 nucleotidyltransferase domain-containing protein [Streptococcus suis]HEM2799829.1 nucleotidyltransferase domain-containing protein [Streptococcus suis]
MHSQEEMMILVPQKLREIEEKYDVEVLWAVESGSRAWGFESPDSDFDVRFIYKRKAQDYLKLTPERDVIELPIDDTWDVNGWDLDKTLRLLAKSNPTLFEWLHSPIVYHRTDFVEKLAPLLETCLSEERMMYHYLSTAKGQMSKYLSGELVNPKKYFYALRPILACEWVKTFHTAPPVLFNELVQNCLPEDLKASVERLVAIKMASSEAAEMEPFQDIHAYLEKSIQELERYLTAQAISHKVDWQVLNDFFLRELGMD